jgi:spore photoproduct lyase
MKVMNFHKVLIEESLKAHPRVQSILKNISTQDILYIPKIEDHFGRTYKPYLHKRTNLNLYIGMKKGQLVKTAPPAYGNQSGPHYYFIHAYNCIYECQYCYLQGYFKSPDIVLFINHEDIVEEMSLILEQHKAEESIWFHAGEFSDSLALSHITSELPTYFDFFEKHPNAKLELRTKSVNIRELIKLKPLSNVYISYSLGPENQCKEIDLKTPPLGHRLKCIATLQAAGFKVGIHFDPIIDSPQLGEQYEDLLQKMLEHKVHISKLAYLSLGVVRFSKDVFTQVQKNYPESPLFRQEFITGFDQKQRYIKPVRNNILNEIKGICLRNGFLNEQIYLCME